MPKRSDIAQLPPAVRDWLDKALVDGGFGGYRALADELKARGYDISKSAIHRYGQDFEAKIEKFRLATERAKAITEAAPDDAGAMGNALTMLVQQMIFDVMLEADEEISPKTLAAIGKTVASLNTSGIAQKKWMLELRAKTQAAAADVEKVARAGGLTDETVETIKRQILGIGA